jgi:hypothetical protein
MKNAEPMGTFNRFGIMALDGREVIGGKPIGGFESHAYKVRTRSQRYKLQALLRREG